MCEVARVGNSFIRGEGYWINLRRNWGDWKNGLISDSVEEVRYIEVANFTGKFDTFKLMPGMVNRVIPCVEMQIR
jgi:hypothetical protein